MLQKNLCGAISDALYYSFDYEIVLLTKNKQLLLNKL